MTDTIPRFAILPKTPSKVGKINCSKPAIGPDLGRLADKPAKDLLKDIVLPDALVLQPGQLFALTIKDGEQLEVVRTGKSVTRIRCMSFLLCYRCYALSKKTSRS